MSGKIISKSTISEKHMKISGRPDEVFIGIYLLQKDFSLMKLAEFQLLRLSKYSSHIYPYFILISIGSCGHAQTRARAQKTCARSSLDVNNSDNAVTFSFLTPVQNFSPISLFRLFIFFQISIFSS
jgi:hypothetical protein